MAEESAERSSIEIKSLCRKLDPKLSSGGGNKERVRRLARFRNYVTGDSTSGNKDKSKKSTPEFYDDDLPILFLGSKAPIEDDDVDDEFVGINLYGLLSACGCPSTDHINQLKRSARNAIMLLKYLVCDHIEYTDGQPLTDIARQNNILHKELNSFAISFCSLNVTFYELMNLELHIIGDKRGGSPEDASEIITLLITRHTTDDGETLLPITLEQLLPTSPEARKVYNNWLVKSKPKETQIAVKDALNKAANYNAQMQQQSASSQQQQAQGGPIDSDDEDDDEGNAALNAFKRNRGGLQKTQSQIEEEEKRTNELAKLGYEGLLMNNAQQSQRAGKFTPDGMPLRWEDSKVCRSLKAREKAKEKGGAGGTGDATSALQALTNEDEMLEKERLDEEKAKLLAKDPLGIHPNTDVCDLRVIQKQRVELLESQLNELDDKINDMYNESNLNDKDKINIINQLEYQKESLESILDTKSVETALHSQGADDHDKKTNSSSNQRTSQTLGVKDGSVLPTDPNFDPLLFLTLVHRNASYEQLSASIERLNMKTEDQALQLQNLVRDNFDLFVRCADGIDVFQEQSIAKQNMNRHTYDKEQGVHDRLNTLDAIAESCSEQARRSFKPLLDNTNEVRKVQAALAVLQRVAPILQAPILMRQHIDNQRYSQAVKEYRRILVIDNNCNIDLFNHIKLNAANAAREAQADLELRLAKDNVSTASLLDGIRDLRELLELNIPDDPNEEKDLAKIIAAERAGVASKEKKAKDKNKTLGLKSLGVGVFDVGGTIVRVRDHTPAMACILLQAAHFTSLVKSSIQQTEYHTQKIYEGESLSKLHGGDTSAIERMLSSTSKKSNSGNTSSQQSLTSETGSAGGSSANKTVSSNKTSSNQWKYDILDARVIATVNAVDIVQRWLPRLLQIGVAAHEDEKRRAARVGNKRRNNDTEESTKVDNDLNTELTAFEVIITNITPALTRIVQHAAFCALGTSNKSSGTEVKMSFGKFAAEKLQTLLRSPLPPLQSSKCSKELAKLVDVIVNSSSTANSLRPADATKSTSYSRLSPLNECRISAEEAVVTVERRRCIYAFDVCARTCGNRASGSGKFDVDALLSCLQSLSEDLTRPEECAGEVEKGCEIVVRRCCEGLASYVRDRGDSARLRAVSECADALMTISDVVREVGYLTNSRIESVEEIMNEDIMGLEGAMFDEFLENIRNNVSFCTRIGWLTADDKPSALDQDASNPPGFPPYLSASLLAIVRCRAQVERALGDTIRRSENTSYQFLAMATASEGAMDGICTEIKERKGGMKVRQADRLANELQFLMNTLKNYLSVDTIEMADAMRKQLCSKAGRGGGMQGGGPDGLAALEDLERLGRVYVMCLGE